MRNINSIQDDLKKNVEEYPALDELKRDIEPYEKIWRLFIELGQKMQEWELGPLGQLNPDDVEADQKRLSNDVKKLIAQLEAKKLTALKSSIAAAMNAKLDAFKPCLPVIRSLCNGGL